MSFSSLEFLIFVSLFLILWSILHPIKWRWYLLSAFSLFFYGWDRPQALLWLFVSVLVDYACGRQLALGRGRKRWLSLSLTTNLGMLGFFKYAYQGPFPIGLSFYTFQSLSYTLDLYRGGGVRAHSFIHFLSYVSMFPQLVAGPICRASDLLKQLTVSKKCTDYEGAMYLVLQGYFKKVFLADHLGHVIDPIFLNKIPYLSSFHAWVLLMAYGWQIYWDFSGYTDIARGIGKMMGVELPINFDRPFLADSLRAFWRRWHISLSTWFRDYVYIPLGGSRQSQGMVLASLLITMFLSGAWHGRTLNFALWGLFHGALLGFEKVMSLHQLSSNNVLLNSLNQMRTYLLVTFGWAFFRVTDGHQLQVMLHKLIFVTTQHHKSLASFHFLYVLILLSVFCEFFIFNRLQRYRLAMMAVFALAVVFLRASPQEFIYYRF